MITKPRCRNNIMPVKMTFKSNTRIIDGDRRCSPKTNHKLHTTLTQYDKKDDKIIFYLIRYFESIIGRGLNEKKLKKMEH